VDLSHHSEVIDTSTFDQILEMDDDDQKEFSRSIVYDFFTQAEGTFDKMDAALYVALHALDLSPGC
jgi:osomolarity two-component system, phosphorelay intermediate protein YPD1